MPRDGTKHSPSTVCSAGKLVLPCRFTLAQRVGCFCNTAVQYGAFGILMGCVRISMGHITATLRMGMDPSSRPQPAEQPFVGSGPGWLYFKGLDSIMRYNAINAAEDVLYSR